MKDQIEKQAIEEMARIAEDAIDNQSPTNCPYFPCCYRNSSVGCDTCVTLNALYNAGYRKQSEGEWEWFEEWNPSTPEHPRECDDCGWRCGECKTALADIVGGYWDDPDEKPNLNFCPNCGAKMKGGAE